MNNNPYRPPVAEVADGAAAHAPQLPRNVSVALYLMGGSLLLQFLVQVWSFQRNGFHILQPRETAIAVAWIALGVLLCHQLARGKGWPRIVLSIVMLGNFVTTAYYLGFALRHSPQDLVFFYSTRFLLNRALPLLMNLVALHLLYFASGDWFREQQ
jgi:hypothetical protein